MKHTHRIKKREHMLAFAAGTTVSFLVALAAAAVAISFGGGREP
jgi:hypothetical protein